MGSVACRQQGEQGPCRTYSIFAPEASTMPFHFA